MSDVETTIQPTNGECWLFQGNPKYFDVRGALQSLGELRWRVNQHQDKVAAGDRVYIWLSGENGGIVGFGEVISNPAELGPDPAETPFNKGPLEDEPRLSVKIRLRQVCEPPIPRSRIVNHDVLAQLAVIKQPQATNYAVPRDQAAALEELMTTRRAKDQALVGAFADFRADPLRQLQQQVRELRAEQLRALFAKPESIDLDTFNREVWNVESSLILDGSEYKGNLYADEPPAEFLEKLRQAIQKGTLELHGNGMWGSAARVYGSSLRGASHEEKLANIQTALKIVTSESLSPVEKAEQIREIPGFGYNSSTGMVMAQHPEEFAIWNGPSSEAMQDLGRGAETLEEFQVNIQRLKKLLGAKTCIELDCFLWQYETTTTLTNDSPRYWAICPGPKGQMWSEFKEAGLIGYPGNVLGDLRNYPSKGAIKEAILKQREIAPIRPAVGSLACHQFAQEMRTGDYVLAKVGRSRLLGVGIVRSDYLHDQSRDEYRNVRQVEWIYDKEVKLPEELKFPRKKLSDVTGRTKLVEYALKLTKAVIDEGEERDDVEFTIDHAIEDLFLTKQQFQEIIDAAQRKKNLILQGPPGVGKTFMVKRLAYCLIGRKLPDQVEMVQFHQSYAYEDFIQGYRPNAAGGFERRDGVFHRFCRRAAENPDRIYVFIIDEVNRGNLSKIFGELLMLIEHDKRGTDFAMPLTYSSSTDKPFFIPENVYLIGMMNTADRSLALVDYALRRRFTFIDLRPQFDSEQFREHLVERGVEGPVIERIIQRMQTLNETIADDKSAELGPGFEIGHSFFCPPDSDEEFSDDWYRSVVVAEIAPLLREYWFDNPQRAADLTKDLLAADPSSL